MCKKDLTKLRDENKNQINICEYAIIIGSQQLLDHLNSNLRT
jgi:hypothetical protein